MPFGCRVCLTNAFGLQQFKMRATPTPQKLNLPQRRATPTQPVAPGSTHIRVTAALLPAPCVHNTLKHTALRVREARCGSRMADASHIDHCNLHVHVAHVVHALYVHALLRLHFPVSVDRNKCATVASGSLNKLTPWSRSLVVAASARTPVISGPWIAVVGWRGET